jgi:hypothetical protein
MAFWSRLKRKPERGFGRPKSSEAINDGGIAAQFTPINARSARFKSPVDGACDQFLSRTGFAQDQNCGI